MPAITALSPSSRRFALALVAACTACSTGAATGQAATFGTQGIPSGPGVSAATVTRGLDQAKRSGAKILRVQADWSALEPTAQGVRSPEAVAALDRIIAGAAQRGMKTILSVSSTPCWASSAPAEARGSCTGAATTSLDVTRYQPADPGSAIPIFTFLAARYADRLAAMQVWNEPDQSNEKYWAGPDKAKNYVRLVKALYAPLKQAAPKVPVIVGSFVGTNGKWLQAMYDNGIKGFYDGLAVQFYRFTLYGLRTTRAVQRKNGDQKPMWLTEWGYTSCYRKGGPSKQIDQVCVSAAGAAGGIADVLTALRKRSFVKAAILYDISDDGPGGYTFGLFSASGRAKASFTAVRRVLAGRIKKPRRPTVRLRKVGHQVVISGTSSLAELVSTTVKVHGQTRLRAQVLSDRRNRYRLVLPAVLGTSAISVRISAGWTGSTSARR